MTQPRPGQTPTDPEKAKPVRLEVKTSADLSAARAAVQKLAGDIGFRLTQQVQIVTAVSEIVRNVLNYAGEGGITARRTQRGIRIEVYDHGPGIPIETLKAVADGTYVSRTGLGKGIAGSRKLMDNFNVMSFPGNTQVVMEKFVQVG